MWGWGFDHVELQGEAVDGLCVKVCGFREMLTYNLIYTGSSYTHTHTRRKLCRGYSFVSLVHLSENGASVQWVMVGVRSGHRV